VHVLWCNLLTGQLFSKGRCNCLTCADFESSCWLPWPPYQVHSAALAACCGPPVATFHALRSAVTLSARPLLHCIVFVPLASVAASVGAFFASSHKLSVHSRRELCSASAAPTRWVCAGTGISWRPVCTHACCAAWPRSTVYISLGFWMVHFDAVGLSPASCPADADARAMYMS
jgi:hypothetical protein